MDPGVEPEGARDDDRADAPGRRLALPHRADRARRRRPTAPSSATSTCAATATRRSAAAISTRWRARWRGGACARSRARSWPIRAASAPTSRSPTPRRADEEPVDATEDTPPGKLSPRVPLVVNHGLMLIRVRPGAEPGAPAEVITTPADPSFAIHNGAVTKAKRRSRVTVRLSVNGSRIQIDVAGRVSPRAAASSFAGACRTRRCTRRR